MSTWVIIAVLLVLGLGALAMIPLMNASTRRSRLAGRRAAPAGSGPGPGSPARVWCERGQRVRRELDRAVAEAPAWQALSLDAGQVCTELERNAAEVAALDEALSGIPVPELERQRDRLADQLRTAEPGRRHELLGAHEATVGRLDLAARQRDARDALLARMEAAVAGLERARDEISSILVEGTGVPQTAPDARQDLADRLAGLRAGLTEVRGLAGSRDDQGGTTRAGQPGRDNQGGENQGRGDQAG